MRSRFLPCCAALTMCVMGAPVALGQTTASTPPAGVAQAAPPSDGPRLIGRGAALSRLEEAAYAARASLCPDELSTGLVGGMTDTETVLLAVAIGLAVVVLVLAID